MTKPLRNAALSPTAFRRWQRKWYRTSDHQLSLRDYVGPFPVGPDGYRPQSVARLAQGFEGIRHHEVLRELPRLSNPHRPEFVFRGMPERFWIAAFDARTDECLAEMRVSGTYCAPAARGQGITSEFHWLLHDTHSKAYSVEDFSRAGFYARVKAHGLILNRSELQGCAIPQEALQGYERRGTGDWTLVDRPDPEEWNASWGIDYDHRHAPSIVAAPMPADEVSEEDRSLSF